MHGKKVSIIIPIYNVEKYLKKCLESVIQQTFKNIEIILVNDGSQDKSLDICLEYQEKDKRIIVINQENSGVSVARNVGLKRASGEYICFIDPDDWIEHNMIEVFYNHIVKTAGNSMVICGCYEEYFSNDTWIETRDYNIVNNGKKNSTEVKENIQEYLEQWRPEVWNKFFPRCIIAEETFNSDIILGEDLEFLSRVYKNVNNFIIVNKCLYHFRVDNSKVKKYQTTQFEAEVKRELLIFDELIEWGVPADKAKNYIKCRLLLISYTSCYYVCRYGHQVDDTMKKIITNSTLKKCTNISPSGRYKRTQFIMKILIKLNSLYLCKQFFSYVVHRRKNK